VTVAPRRTGIAGWLDSIRSFEPDARRYLVGSLVAGAASSLWWIDFNLYLVSLGLSAATIGLIATVSSLAAAVIAIPASLLSDHVGRRLVMAGASVACVIAPLGLAAVAGGLAIVPLVALFSAANAAFGVVSSPFMTEHSKPEHRSELFALQFAITNSTNIVAAALGGYVAVQIAIALGFRPGSPEVYRVILAMIGVLFVPTLALVLRLSDDRPSARRLRAARATGEPAWLPAPPVAPAISITRLGLTIRNGGLFARLLLPTFIISVGAGQVIPFLNVFVQARFGLDVVALNAVFAVTSLGTMLAILFQPSVARRFGRIRSVILVQGASIPFLVVLGFSPILWTVIAAMAVRNSLMNAGNPIFNAFAMDQVSPPERASLAALMSLEWSFGWVLAGAYYSAIHALIASFDLAYAVNFATIIVLYSIATFLYWRWFGRGEARAIGPAAPAGVTD
jgi:MFS family permease